MEKKDKRNNKKMLARSIGVGAGTAIGTQQAKKHLAKALRESNRKNQLPTSEEWVNMKKLFKKIDDAGYNILKTNKENQTGIDPVNKNIQFNVTKDGPAAIAHELGHAEIGNKSPIPDKYKIKIRKLNKKMNKINPAIAGTGIGTHMLTKNQNPELAKKIRNATLLSTGLSSLPMLANEGLASLKGAKHLKELGALDSNAKKELTKYFGTYGSTLLPFAASAGYFGYDALKNRKRENEGRK